jgi:hypothetical protein
MGRVMLSPAGQSHFLSTLDAGWMEGRGCRFEVDGGLPVSRVRGWAGRGEVVDGSRGRRDRRLCERSRKLMVRFVEKAVKDGGSMCFFRPCEVDGKKWVTGAPAAFWLVASGPCCCGALCGHADKWLMCREKNA